MAIQLAFIWHMHQPYYKNNADHSYLLPWVRLHGLKDYYGMVRILREFPELKQNFNLVPSLMIQLDDYVHGRAREAMLELSLKPVSELEEPDKGYLLRYFFYANKENLIARFPRYWELLEKRGFEGSIDDMEHARATYTSQDYLDLQILQKLAWMDEEYLVSDPEVTRLVEKERFFDENDKTILHQKELELLRSILPEYKEARKRGQVELSTTPFYHPILPLLVNTRIAKESQPSALLPMLEFARPEDARMQIQRAMAYHEKVFGERPVGCWPSEGSVSEHILPLLTEAGIQWIASDEEILLHSIEKKPVHEKARWCASNLYSSYEKLSIGKPIHIVFRDHVLSDLIGFHYSRVSPADAAEDFLKRLYDIDQRCLAERAQDGPPLVSIILDGENAWEYYPKNGRDFLRALYSRITKEPWIQSTTIGEYVQSYGGRSLAKLFPGSWINHNFAIWIGHPEDNKGWDFLKEARDLIDYARVNEPQKADLIEKAYEEILIAEGSDWFWWFGEDHSSENDAEFDRLFRQHISNVYHFLGKPVPEALLLPIKAPRAPSLVYRVPRRFVSPKLDGEVTNYFEWLTAGHYYVADQFGTMHRAGTIIGQILFGFDTENAYFRMDFHQHSPVTMFREGYGFQIFILPSFILSIYPKEDGTIEMSLEKERDDGWIRLDHHCECGVGSILEVKVPFEDLNARSGDTIRFRIMLSQKDIVLEEHPQAGSIQFQAPGPHFEEMDWEV
ncbi:glycoside hydrolase family 57 protein [bacterium]|nr:glycoside hydrolase family 57 protein [bacterium]